MKLKNNLSGPWLVLLLIPTFLTACHSFKPGKEIKPHIEQELAQAPVKTKEIAPLQMPSALTQSLLSSINNEQTISDELAIKRFDVAANNVEVGAFFAGLTDGTPFSVAVHPEVSGSISINLKNVTFNEVIAVIKRMYPLDIVNEGRIVQVLPAQMRTETIPVNYLMMQRHGQSTVSVVAGGVSQFGQGGNSSGSSSSSSNQQSSEFGSSNQNLELNGSRIQTINQNDFWKELEVALKSLIGVSDGRYVIASPQASLVTVNALPSEISQLKEFLNQSQENLQRQVILEAKIIEVTLKDEYQQGVNWERISSGLEGGISFATTGGSTISNSISAAIGGASSLTIQKGDFNGVINLLETQGDVQMLSNPRVTATNNQKAVIKVGQDEYFVTNVSSTTVTGTSTTTSPEIDLTPFFSGIALDVTPQIDKYGSVILHVHPSVTETEEQLKVITLDDQRFELPLAQSNIRESDTVIRAQSGEIVVIGGLMQTSTEDEESKTPVLGDIPMFGNLFKSIRKRQEKKELIILIKPTVVMPDTWKKQQGESRQLLKTWYEN
ncbi:pilus (MSHA type) biogenesis protein MshL [Pseudoalteromonas sp. MMG007]|uniref:pilus (MSHA type) biogenesis protein MshL n=1 Tax=Pseudoalteromonas sp. MMG007 TaxID=2822684 RepID=UPI001B35C913|nr:pilus (MSHA type) biogenesis protein MshL [Pseudoalteromonas sp. MMG007]MBQ4858366.1 pilus (MSHA type) biogenesis protein MshL [Pseudoalteromonas sp. MMG007]